MRLDSLGGPECLGPAMCGPSDDFIFRRKCTTSYKCLITSLLMTQRAVPA